MMKNISTGFFLVLFLYSSSFMFDALASNIPNKELDKTNVISHISEAFVSVSSPVLYASLAVDPKAALPKSFTICSTTMAPTLINPISLAFFYLWGAPAFPLVSVRKTKEGIETRYNYFKAIENNGKEAHVFSHKWVKGCVAFNQNLSLIQWVVDGTLVQNKNYSKLDSLGIPTNLTENLLVGGGANGKVTNVNVFSTAHTVAVMEQNTQAGTCIEGGDYLAWNDMQWILNDGAVTETFDAEETCIGEPPVDIYNAYRSQLSCVQFCEHLGSRAPSFVNMEEWNALQNLFERPAYKKGLDSVIFWAAIDDKKKEGEWRDYYTHEVMNQSEIWVPGAPDRGTDENCAIWGSGYGLNDQSCHSEDSICTCKRRPHHYLKLRGLCNDSAIDVFYQPMNNPGDVKKINFYGLLTDIKYDQKRHLWKLSVTSENNVTALSKASLKSYTLGRHNWTVTGDENCNEQIDRNTYTKGSHYLKKKL